MIKVSFILFALTSSLCINAANSGSLLLSSRIGVNIDYRIDENNNIRIVSNAPFKKNLRSYVFKSRNLSLSKNDKSRYQVLEIEAN
ncbi:hypothetical protein [Halobacteriovorax sp. JY17]|uniref:hypothetical protein n=1 Tax=Halobacteriovorax sp. JY17 TaxID=2014617 RepID=UPI000C668B17|nr:hypothetical protein [Halobacteriovorax sp. JY17]PIK15601.1 MAG: hypothetical protein CES88_02435 [Halobacteriovorax sp. JY17]